jgi:hypothetical protein
MAVIGEFNYTEAAEILSAAQLEAEQAAGASVGVEVTPSEVPEPAPQPKAKTPK